MKALPSLAAKSAWNRRYTLGLVIGTLALSVCLLLGIERIQHTLRSSFAQSVSGTDLVIGARSSPLQLMLYTVFHLGEATNNISWKSVETLSKHPAVSWIAPVSLGDSHKGFPVVGTTSGYFEHFRHGDRQNLRFAQGRSFQGVFEAVLGADVAEKLNYRMGQQLVLAHGAGGSILSEHADKPFTVTGILARTGTPVDRTVHIRLEGMSAIHIDWQSGAPIPGLSVPADMVRKFDLTPKDVTAVLVGLKSRAGVFAMQRDVAKFSDEPLMAVLPGVALDQLWQLMEYGERALWLVAALALMIGLTGQIAVVLASLNERRRELAILRSVGARPMDILMLLSIEGLAVTLAGAIGGVLSLAIAMATLGPWLETRFGLAIHTMPFTLGEWQLLGAISFAGFIAGLIPAYRAYRLSLADGLVPRL